MISALNLIWIIPVSVCVGFCVAALFHIATDPLPPDSDSVKTHMLSEIRKGKGGI
jgi:hypothetical protein